MSSLWWFFLWIPLYAVTGGFTGRFIHRQSWHQNRHGDCNGPECILSGLAWPVVPVIAALWWCVLLGMGLEKRIVPSSRRIERDKAIARDEKAIYGRVRD